MDFAHHRQLFLTEQGYNYEIVDETDLVPAESAPMKPSLTPNPRQAAQKCGSRAYHRSAARRRAAGRKTLARWVVGRLSDTVLLVQSGESELVIDELRKLGHTPRVVGREGLTEMPQVSQSSLNRSPDDRADLRRRRAARRDEPRYAFRAALSRYKGTRLAAIRLAQAPGAGGFRVRPSGAADEIADYLDEPAAVLALIARLSPESQLAIEPVRPDRSDLVAAGGDFSTLRTLSAEPLPAILPLLELGLLAVIAEGDPGQIDGFDEILQSEDPCARVPPRSPGRAQERCVPRGRKTCCHGRAVRSARFAKRMGSRRSSPGGPRQRLGAEPLRQTQQGVLYKRDRDRIDLDPVSQAPLPTRSSRCPIHLRCGWPWPVESD